MAQRAVDKIRTQTSRNTISRSVSVTQRCIASNLAIAVAAVVAVVPTIRTIHGVAEAAPVAEAAAVHAVRGTRICPISSYPPS